MIYTSTMVYDILTIVIGFYNPANITSWRLYNSNFNIYICIYTHHFHTPHFLLEAQQNRGPEKIWKSMVTCGRPGPVN